MNKEQAELLMKLIQKYQSGAIDIIRDVKNGIKDYSEFGHKAEDFVNSLLNLSVKDIIC